MSYEQILYEHPVKRHIHPVNFIQPSGILIFEHQVQYHINNRYNVIGTPSTIPYKHHIYKEIYLQII